MKIVITSDWPTTVVNGVATSVKNLEKGLTANGHEVRIICLANAINSYQDGNTYYLSSLSASQIYPKARIRIPMRTRFYDKMMKELIEWGPDVIHSQCEFSTFFVARRLSVHTGAPIVHTYHTIYEDYTNYFSGFEKLGRYAVKIFTKHISKYTDSMVAPTKKTKDILLSYGCTVPIEIVPSGLDLDLIVSNLQKKEIEERKKSLNIPLKNKVLIYLGRLAEEKHLEEIIEFLGKIRPKNTTFLITGGGPHEKTIKDAIHENGIEDFTVMTGLVPPDEVKNYYALGNIFVSASQSETQGLTYIEAMANSLPLLCRKDSCLEGILDQGETGYTYSDFEEFKKYLKILLTKDTKKMGIKASAVTKEKFSLQRFASDIEKVYTETIANVKKNSD